LSILELKSEIEGKAEEEASRILQEAKVEAERMISEANARAESLKDERTKALIRELETEGRAELAIARMNKKGELLRVKSEWANRVFEESGKRIGQIAEKGTAEYRELLGKLVLEGIAKIKGNEFIVEANSRDVELIRKELRTIMETAAKIKNEKVEVRTRAFGAASLGGVVVTTKDMAQYYNNTLEARLSVARQNLGGEVYKILFKGGE